MTQLPQFLEEFAKQLPFRALLPFRGGLSPEEGGGDFVALITRDSDEVIRDLDDDPLIEAAPLRTKCIIALTEPKEVWMMHVLLRVTGKVQLSYDVAFDLADPFERRNAEVFAHQNLIELVMVGESTSTVLHASLEPFHHHLQAILGVAQRECSFQWTREEFAAALNELHALSAGPNGLWHLFSHYGSCVEIAERSAA